MYAISVVTAPAVDAASLGEVKDHLRIDGNDDNEHIARLIKAAVDRVEAYTGRRLIDQTLDVHFPYYMLLRRDIDLPIAPVSDVTSIEVTGPDGATTVVDPADYSLIGLGGPRAQAPVIRLAHGKAWPSSDVTITYPVTIRLTAGYGAAATQVPEALAAGDEHDGGWVVRG